MIGNREKRYFKKLLLEGLAADAALDKNKMRGADLPSGFSDGNQMSFCMRSMDLMAILYRQVIHCCIHFYYAFIHNVSRSKRTFYAA